MSKGLRLLIVSREYPPASEGGISRRLSNLVPRLVEKGLSVEVVCFEGERISEEKVHSMKTHSPILYTRNREPSLKDTANLLTDIIRINRYASKIMSKQKYDVVQIEDPVFSPFVRRNQVPKIVTVHTTQIGELFALWRTFSKFNQLKRLIFSGTLGISFDCMGLKDAEVIVAVGPTVRDELIHFYKILPKKIHIIFNGVNLPDKINKEKSKKNLGISKKLFVYVGRLVDRKRVGDLLKAVHLLNKNGKVNFSVIIVGSGPMKNSLTELAIKLRISHLVKFTGYIKDTELFKILEAADAFVLPSCYEGHPITVLEAMAFGCLPIVTDIQQMASIIHPGRNGLSFPVGNVKALKNVMNRTTEDNQLTHTLAAEARKDAYNFSWEHAVDKHVRIYNELSNLSSLV